jgi:hypothetical protein
LSQNQDPTGNNIYGYFKVVERTDTLTNTTTTWKYNVNYDKVTANVPTDVPYDYYLNLSTSGTYTNYTIWWCHGKRKRLPGTYQTFYDYETELNDAKRSIKLVRPEYYGQIVAELKNLVGAKDPIKRTLK